MPIVLIIVGWALGAVLPTLILGLLALLPLPFMNVPLNMETLTGWCAKQIVRYFSFKVSFVEALPDNKAHILVSVGKAINEECYEISGVKIYNVFQVAPPHGVFPFGNITTMIGAIM